MSRGQSKSVGIDIGGANIKLSDGRLYHRHVPFALWQKPDSLAEQLSVLLRECPTHDRVAITMTGELTDCFANKRTGVAFIVDHSCRVTDVPVAYYLLDGRFVDAQTARQEFMLAAASNWHALTQFVAQEVVAGECGLLLDVGSTTTDVIAFRDGDVIANGTDDFGRLSNGELVYTGSVRSALNGIVRSVSHRGIECPVMNENFATALDTNIVLGHLPADQNEYYTADGESASIESCVRRIARLIGKDELTFDLEDAIEIACQVFDIQKQTIADAAQKVMELHKISNPVIVLSGQGEFLAKSVSDSIAQNASTKKVVSLSRHLGEAASSCATAFAIARLDLAKSPTLSSPREVTA